MSLDIHLTFPLDTGGEEYSATVFDSNMTHNVTPMWRKAGVYDALYMSHGRKASEFVDALRIGVALMESDPLGYRDLNPSNGWGSYETALPWLRTVLAAFERFPKATIGVSK